MEFKCNALKTAALLLREPPSLPSLLLPSFAPPALLGVPADVCRAQRGTDTLVSCSHDVLPPPSVKHHQVSHPPHHKSNTQLVTLGAYSAALHNDPYLLLGTAPHNILRARAGVDTMYSTQHQPNSSAACDDTTSVHFLGDALSTNINQPGGITAALL